MRVKEHGFYKIAIKGLLPRQEHIRREILAQAHPAKKLPKKKTWLTPVLTGVAAVIVVCAAVPDARAAISQWFRENFSVQNYVAQPAEARPSTPELDALIDQAKPKDAEAVNSIEIVNVTPEWQKWADSLNPAVGDVFYDGKELIVSFDMGGGAAELIMGGVYTTGAESPFPISVRTGDPGYIKLNGTKYAYNVMSGPAESSFRKYQSLFEEDGPAGNRAAQRIREADTVPYTATIDFSRTSADYIADFDGLPEERQALILEEIKRAQQYDPEYTPFAFKTLPESRLSGIQEVEVNISLWATDYSKPAQEDAEGTTWQSEYIGMVKLRFSFDPTAGSQNKQIYEVSRTSEFTGEGTYRWADWESDPGYVTCTNKTIDMKGVTMTAKRIDSYASGAELYVSVTCPDDWDPLDKECFLSSLTPRVLGDGDALPTTGEQYGLKENGEDLGMCIYLKLLPSELDAIDTFEVIPVLSRYSGYDDMPYEEGRPTRIPKDAVHGWQEESTELTDCALQFSLK